MSASATPVLPGSGARQIIEQLRGAGFQALLAGGCVRDLLLGRIPKDMDIATDARPDQVQALFPNTKAVGRSFGVVLVEIEGTYFEVATFRSETDYTDGRRPDTVHFTTAEIDARRRDFTINGLFLDPVSGAVHDYVGGRADLDQRIVRAIGDPNRRFAEDHLRLLRAIRFTATLGFQLDPSTATAIAQHAEALRRISAERIQIELTRILTEAKAPGQAIDLMQKTGLLAVILPEVESLRGVEQPPEYHPEGDVYRHTIAMLDLLKQPSAELAWAVLLHDIGKPSTHRRVPGIDGRLRIRFDEHAAVGARMCEAILHRLRCSRQFTEHVVACVRDHMRFIDVQHMRTATLRRMVMSQTFDTELELHRIDCLGSHGNLNNYHFVRDFAARLAAEPRKPTPLLNGHDVLAGGRIAGPEIGRVLNEAYELQLGGQLSDRDQALAWLAGRLAGRSDDAARPQSPGPAEDSSA